MSPPFEKIEDTECLPAAEQVGGANKLWMSDRHYTSREVSTRQARKFKITATDYHLSLIPQSGELPLTDQLGSIFDSMVNEMTTGMCSSLQSQRRRNLPRESTFHQTKC